MTDITIGRLSSATGVKVETIRYYEKIGLMPDPPRTEGGQRVYSPDHQDRLAFIKRSRDLGFPITAVRSLLGLNDEPPSCGEVQAITMSHLETIKTKVADLKRLQKTLNAIVLDCEDGESPDCPIIHALSATASSK